jgi:hypothetical protein
MILLGVLIVCIFWSIGGDDGEPWDHNTLRRAVTGEDDGV